MTIVKQSRQQVAKAKEAALAKVAQAEKATLERAATAEEDASSRPATTEKEALVRAAKADEDASAKATKAAKDTESKYLAKYEALKAELTEEFRQKDLDMWNKTSQFNSEMKKAQDERS